MERTLTKQGLILEYITLGWNVVGCIIILVSAYQSGSLALTGFGFDSMIEICASVVVVWQLQSIHADKEKIATKLIGVAFLLLSIYLSIQAVVAVMFALHPRVSVVGAWWLVITALVMFALAWGKLRVGNKLHNSILVKEAKITLVDGFLALAVLLGLLVHMYLGFWWADVVASLVIVCYGISESIHAFI
jgi:divalent metal cation (Fe/Co/Zn/Cd) transporter